MKTLLVVLSSLMLFSCTSTSGSNVVKEAEELIAKGQVVEANVKLKKACDDKDAGACIYLAKVAEKTNDVEGSKKFYELACLSKSGYGCQMRGSLEVTPEGPNFESMTMYYNKGCDLDESLSCYLLGDLNYETKKTKEAKIYMNKACDLGLAIACEKLKNIENYQPRSKDQMSADNQLAMCHSGQVFACKNPPIKTSN